MDGMERRQADGHPSDGHPAGFHVGIDLGGTKLIGAIAGADGRILAEREEPTRHDRPDAALDQVAALVRSLIADAGTDAGAGGLRTVAIGVPAAVDPASGHLAISPNIAFPGGRSFADAVAGALGSRVTVDNDVNLAAYGEWRLGAGRGSASLAFVAFGTGIGAGIVLNGDIWRGTAGRAGEICFLPITDGDAFAVAAATEAGPLEDAAGSFGIVRRYGVPGASVRDVFARAAAGDAAAVAAIDTTIRLSAMGLAALLTLIDPEVLVIGGGIGSNPAFAGPLMDATGRLLPFRPQVLTSALGPRAGLLGALQFAIDAAAPLPAAGAGTTNR